MIALPMIALPQETKLKNNLPAIEIFGNIIIWIFISIFTFGLALFVVPYYIHKLVINATDIVDVHNGNKIGKLHCDLSLSSAIGHGLLWLLIIIITLGIGSFFYLYKEEAFVISHTKIVIFESPQSPLP